MEKLFYDDDNKLYTVEDIKNALFEIGADDCETLFIHSDVMFGKPAEGFKRKEYLGTLYEVVNVNNLGGEEFNSSDFHIQLSK